MFGADYFDSMPHTTTDLTDFHEKIIADFEQWRNAVVPGASRAEKAAYIRSNLFNQWNDYFSHAYAEWYAKIVREIERRTGDSSRVVIQVEWTLPAARRYKCSDMRIYRELFSRPDQFLYHIQVWYCMGSDEQASHTSWLTGSLGTHLCREPGLFGGGHFINTGKDQMAYVDSAHVMRLWGRVSEFCTARGLTLAAEQKTELGCGRRRANG